MQGSQAAAVTLEEVIRLTGTDLDEPFQSTDALN